MVPEHRESDGAAISRAARRFLETGWQGQTMMAIGMQDPVLGESVMLQLQQTILGCPEPIRVNEGGHFLQELGEPLAQAAVRFFKTT
jgi:hypothetical protein